MPTDERPPWRPASVHVRARGLHIEVVRLALRLTFFSDTLRSPVSTVVNGDTFPEMVLSSGPLGACTCPASFAPRQACHTCRPHIVRFAHTTAASHLCILPCTSGWAGASYPHWQTATAWPHVSLVMASAEISSSSPHCQWSLYTPRASLLASGAEPKRHYGHFPHIQRLLLSGLVRLTLTGLKWPLEVDRHAHTAAPERHPTSPSGGSIGSLPLGVLVCLGIPALLWIDLTLTRAAQHGHRLREAIMCSSHVHFSPALNRTPKCCTPSSKEEVQGDGARLPLHRGRAWASRLRDRVPHLPF